MGERGPTAEAVVEAKSVVLVEVTVVAAVLAVVARVVPPCEGTRDMLRLGGRGDQGERVDRFTKRSRTYLLSLCRPWTLC